MSSVVDMSKKLAPVASGCLKQAIMRFGFRHSKHCRYSFTSFLWHVMITEVEGEKLPGT